MLQAVMSRTGVPLAEVAALEVAGAPGMLGNVRGLGYRLLGDQ